MFYNLSAEQIAKIKTKFYPQEVTTGEFLKSVVVNDAGSDNPDNILKVVFSINDGAAGLFKVFNNETAKKYMRLKVFEVLSEQMLTDVKAFKDIQDLENIINFYGSLTYDLHASYDFLGNKTILEDHYRLQDGSIELVYNLTFNIARPKINFLSLGAIFYFDKQQYISDQKVEQQFIDERILYNKLLVYDLYKNNQIVDSQASLVQDLRLVKSTFKETGFLQNLLDTVNSDKMYQNLTSNNRQAAIDKLSPTNISPEITISEAKSVLPFVNKKLIRARPIKTVKTTRKAFSSASYSRNSNLFLGFVFSMDYEYIVINNTPYPSILAMSDLKKELLDKCKISSINILRRKVDNLGKNKYVPKLDTTVAIVSSGETKDANVVSTVENNNGSISEINLATGAKSTIRSFAVTDKKIFIDTAGFYQYGVEINITDGITKFLSDHADDLLADITDLKTYLEETNKIVTIAVKDNKNVVKGVYDPQKNSFTNEFVQNFSKPRGNEKSFASIVAHAAATFEATLNLMGIFTSQLTSRQLLQGSLTNTIISLLNPQSTNAESISFFIKIMEKLVNQINRIVKNNFNNTYKVTYWFSNDYVDSLTPINIGYRFFDMPQYTSLGLLNTDDLNNRIRTEVGRYSANQVATALALTGEQYSFVSPNAVFSKNKIVNISNLNVNPNGVSTLDFAELEIDIKSGKDNLNASEKEKVLYQTTDRFKNKIINTAIKANNFSKNLSLQLKNSFKEKIDLEPIKQNLPLEKNDNVNETNLMLALAKQFDLTTGKYHAAVANNNSNILPKELLKVPRTLQNKIEKFSTGDILNKRANALAKPLPSLALFDNEQIPFQVNLLLEDRCDLLKSSDNYKKSLEQNSKFQFLFNTLHSIEILEFANNMIDERWTVITKEKIENLQKDSIYLFRIKGYRNPSLGIDGIEQIKLPVYDQYFFFKKTDPSRRLDVLPKKILRGVTQDKINLFNDKFKSISAAAPKLVSNVVANRQPASKTPFSPRTTKKGGR